MPVLARRQTTPAAEVDLLTLERLSDHPLVKASLERPSELARRRRQVEEALAALRHGRLPLEREKTSRVSRGEELSSEAAAELQDIEERIALLDRERRVLLGSRAASDQAQHEARAQVAGLVNLALKEEAIPHLKRVLPGLAALLPDIEALRALYSRSVRVCGMGTEHALSQALAAPWPGKEWLSYAEKLLASYEYSVREGGAS